MTNAPYDPALSGGRSLSGQAARSSLFLFIAKGIRYSFAFIVQLVLMNLLAPADFGLVRFVTIIIGVIGLINELGLSFAVVQKKTLLDDELSAVFSLNALLCGGLYLLLFFLAPPFASFFGDAQLTVLVRVGAFACFFGGLSVVHRSLLQRQLRYGLLAVTEVLSAILGSAGSLVLAVMGFGVWSLLAGMFIYNILSSLLTLTIVPWPRGNYMKLAAGKALFMFGGAVVVRRILNYGVQNIDNLAVGKWFGAKVLGIYGFAHTLMMVPALAFGVVLGGILFSTFSRVQDDDKRLVSAFLKVNALTSTISIPYFVLLVSFAREMTHAVSFINHGDTWTPATIPIKILALLGLFVSFTSYPGIIWMAKGRVRLMIYWELIGLLAIVAAVFAGRPWGVNGICVALVIRGILMFPAHLTITNRVVGLLPLEFLKTLFPGLCCGLVMFAFTALFAKLVPGDSFPRDLFTLLAGSAGGLVVYFLMLFFIFKETWKSIGEMALSLRKSV